MKYSLMVGQPRAEDLRAPLPAPAPSVTGLLMIARMRSVAASGANVKPPRFAFLAAHPSAPPTRSRCAARAARCEVLLARSARPPPHQLQNLACSRTTTAKAAPPLRSRCARRPVVDGLQDLRHAALAHRPRDHAGLAEAAAARAAAHDLDRDAVVHRVDVGHDEPGERRGQRGHDALEHRGRARPGCSGAHRRAPCRRRGRRPAYSAGTYTPGTRARRCKQRRACLARGVAFQA